MAGERYVPIRYEDIREVLEDLMGFERRDDDRCWEMIWVRPVITKSGVRFPYEIKVYTTVDIRTEVSRDVGTDAIRVVLMDTVTGRPVKKAEKRVFRTKNALTNLRERCRDMFKHVMQGPHCPKCSSLMVVREGGPGKHKFWGCTHYAPKNSYHCNSTMPCNEKEAA